VPRVRSAPDLSYRLTGPPGHLEGVQEVDESGGGVLAKCGVCGNREFIEIPARTSPSMTPKREIRRALRLRGWRFLPPYEWGHDECIERARRGVRAGHIQTEMFNR